MTEKVGQHPNVSLFTILTDQYYVGGLVAEMHAYRFREPTISPKDLLSIPIAEAGSLDTHDVLPVIASLQATSEHKLVLTGGWATQLHSGKLLRPTSSEIDFLAHPYALTTDLNRKLKLHHVPNWGCRIGFTDIPDGRNIRVEINTVDILPEVEELEVNGERIIIASPLTIVLGKMARSFSRGIKERDQIDISALILSKHSSSLSQQLKNEIELNPTVLEAWKNLNLPESVVNYFNWDEQCAISNFSLAFV